MNGLVSDRHTATAHRPSDITAGQPNYANGDHQLRPEPDRILVAQLTGKVWRHAKWRPLSEDEEAIALAELRAFAADRADLLAEVAEILTGARFLVPVKLEVPIKLERAVRGTEVLVACRSRPL